MSDKFEICGSRNKKNYELVMVVWESLIPGIFFQLLYMFYALYLPKTIWVISRFSLNLLFYSADTIVSNVLNILIKLFSIHAWYSFLCLNEILKNCTQIDLKYFLQCQRFRMGVWGKRECIILRDFGVGTNIWKYVWMLHHKENKKGYYWQWHQNIE